MKELIAVAEKSAAILKARKQTITVAESTTGGLISSALLAVPGASAFFIGGAVVYTRQARNLYLGVPDAELKGKRPITPDYEFIIARHARERLAATWCLGEHGAAGPEGNRYGDPAGRSCIVLVGPSERSTTIETGRSDRAENMQLFAAAALKFLSESLEA
jgi:PncC family amidohydrolase